MCESEISFTLKKGADEYRFVFFYDEGQPLDDLTGFDIKIQVRNKPSKSDVILYELTQANNRIEKMPKIRSRTMANAGATVIQVDALSNPLIAGQILDFAGLLVTVGGDAGEGEDEIKVLALTGVLAMGSLAPSGCIRLLFEGIETEAATWKRAGFDVMIAPTGQYAAPLVSGQITLEPVFTYA